MGLKKHYKIKITPQLKKKFKYWWREFKIIHDKFYGEIFELEKRMAKDTGIKDIEFFKSDIDWAGIGNVSRTIPLWQGDLG